MLKTFLPYPLHPNTKPSPTMLRDGWEMGRRWVSVGKDLIGITTYFRAFYKFSFAGYIFLFIFAVGFLTLKSLHETNYQYFINNYRIFGAFWRACRHPNYSRIISDQPSPTIIGIGTTAHPSILLRKIEFIKIVKQQARKQHLSPYISSTITGGSKKKF